MNCPDFIMIRQQLIILAECAERLGPLDDFILAIDAHEDESSRHSLRWLAGRTDAYRRMIESPLRELKTRQK